MKNEILLPPAESIRESNRCLLQQILVTLFIPSVFTDQEVQSLGTYEELRNSQKTHKLKWNGILQTIHMYPVTVHTNTQTLHMYPIMMACKQGT